MLLRVGLCRRRYIQEELHNDISRFDVVGKAPGLETHCSLGENNIAKLPFHSKVPHVILYHHENANGSGPYGKTWQEPPFFSRIIHLCDTVDAFDKEKQETLDAGMNFHMAKPIDPFALYEDLTEYRKCN